MRTGSSKRAVAVVVVATAAAAIALSASLGAGGASASRGKVFAVKDCTKPRVRPPRIVLACGDGAVFINAIDYGSWGGRSVHGRAVLHAKSCNPNCIVSPFKEYPVKFRLYRIGHESCGGRSVRMYKRIHVHPTDKTPPRFGPYKDMKPVCY